MAIKDIDIGGMKEYVEAGGTRSRSDFYTCPEGHTEIEIKGEPGKPVVRRFDFIPYVVSDPNHPTKRCDVGGLWWERTLWLHRNSGPDKANFVCPKSHGRKCFGCQRVAALYDDGYDKNKDEIQDLKAQKLQAFNVIDRDNPEAGIQLWVYSTGKFFNKLKEILEAEADDRLYGFASLKRGLTLKITFGLEKFGKNTFWETKLIKFEEREEQYDESILDDVIDLDKIIGAAPSYEETMALFLGNSDAPKEREVREREVSERNEPEERQERRRYKVEPLADEEIPHMGGESKTSKPEPESKPKPEPKQSCPNGHALGECDSHDDCDKCPDITWDACMKAKVAARKNRG